MGGAIRFANSPVDGVLVLLKRRTVKFTQTILPGAWIIESEFLEDDRGYFARFFSQPDFAERGLETQFPEWSTSFNRTKGTIRGMHFQIAPFDEAKIVRCISGAIFDVLVDVRPSSREYGRWFGIELSAGDPRSVYIPKGVAHGFQALMDNTELNYFISSPHSPKFSSGFRWDDPQVGISWPQLPTKISLRDQKLGSFADLQC